jgi:hypothetical protein
MSEGYELVLAFRDQSPSFAHGFTLGRIWQQMRMRTAPFSETIPLELREDVIVLATAAGWMEEFLAIDERGQWLRVTFMSEQPATPDNRMVK